MNDWQHQQFGYFHFQLSSEIHQKLWKWKYRWKNSYYLGDWSPKLSVHFDRFALFLIFILLMINFLPLQDFRIKTFSNENCHFELSLCNLIFTDRLFLLYKSPFEKILKNARTLSKVPKLKKKPIFIIKKSWKRSRSPV